MTELAILYYFAAFAGIAFVFCYIALACYRSIRRQWRALQVQQDVRDSREFYERNRGTWDTRSAHGLNQLKLRTRNTVPADRVSRVNGKAS